MQALDAATAEPDPQECLDNGYLFIAKYVGTQFQSYGVRRQYVDRCHAVGFGVMLIFEEWGSQFLGGYDAAVASCARMMASWDALGAPRDGSVFPAVALVDPNPGVVPGNEEALRQYARGWNDALPFTAFTGYGSRYGLEIASATAPKMTRRWGVGTWGYGEGPGGNLPPNVPADMIQHGNKGAALPNCDHNTLFRADMGQWGGAPHQEDEDMKSMLLHKPGDLTIWLYDPANGTKTKLTPATFAGAKALAPVTGLNVGGPDNGAYPADPAFIDDLLELKEGTGSGTVPKDVATKADVESLRPDINKPRITAPAP